MKRKYSWLPDIPDPRDKKFDTEHHLKMIGVLPPKIDNAGLVNTVYDQGNLGSCTGNSSALAFDFGRKHCGLSPILPSRLMIYYNERVIEGTVSEDAGAMNRDAIKSLNQTGVCTEKTWPYVETRFAKKPTSKAYTQASGHKAISYQRIDNTNLQAIKAAVASYSGFIFGFTVFDSFESDQVAKTGIVPMPDINKESVLGGHSVFCLGYDDTTRMFKVRNSWSAGWGDKGHFYIPYDYLTNSDLADDFWAISVAK